MNNNHYNLKVSSDLDDPNWDSYVGQAAGGHIAQTSLWAQIKAPLGWRPFRIIASQQGSIVGGVQILFRSLKYIGRLGYVTKGPLFSTNDSILEEFIMEQIHRVSKENHLQYLVIQPPSNRQDLCNRLQQWGFTESLMAFTPSPYATLRIDLQKDLDDILANMKQKTRYNIRLAGHKGITVREGCEQDIKAFHQSLLATSERNNFTEYPEEYWDKFFKLYMPRGYAKIFIAEYEGNVISSIMLTSFNDTATYKKGGWFGSHRNLHANELLHWEAMKWSKRQGYHYYDFEGIVPEAARSIEKLGSLPKKYERSLTSFKYGFGGDVIFYPGAYDYCYHPLLRWFLLNIFEKVRYRSDVDYIINRILRS